MKTAHQNVPVPVQDQDVANKKYVDDNSGAGGAVIFDDSTAGANSNIRSDRAANQSPIDNTKSKIVNLGSQTHTNDATATGVTAVAGTIGGGDDNTVDADYGTVAGGYGNHAHGLNAAIPGGLNNKANGIASFAMGEGSIASGEASCAIGDGCRVPGEQGAAAFGNGCTASGESSFAAGVGSTASGDYSLAIGDGCIASGSEGAFAIGDGCEATGESSFAQGDGSSASALASVSLGMSVANGIASCAVNSSFAFGDYSFSTGFSQAKGKFAVAQGPGAYALRDGQRSLSSGYFNYNPPYGSAQDSKLTFLGSTPGLATGETVELLYGQAGSAGQQFVLEDNKSYMLQVRVSAGAVQGVNHVTCGWILELSVRRKAGVTTIGAAGTPRVFSETGTADWTFVISVGTSPDRLQFQFTTGAVTSAAHVVAAVDFTECRFV